MTASIYLDHAATTPLDPRVREAMEPFLSGLYGNPSSLHQAGREARRAVDEARRQVAELFAADPSEIVFTASGTESDNMALTGVLALSGFRDSHLITSAIEHPAILETCNHLTRQGVAVTRVPVDADGMVDPATVAAAIRPETRLISIMAANNVVGTIQPVAEIGRIARARGVLFHTDAVQAAGKIPLDLRVLPVDLLSVSAHKLHGPKGVGALYVRRGVRLEPLVHGGGQENGLRSATPNVMGIAGLGRAAEIARQEMAEEAARLVGLRERIIDGIAARVPGVYSIGHRFRRLPGHICLGFSGLEGDAITLLLILDELGIAVSSGSACSASHAGEPSYILLAMGFDPVRARGSLRITLGRFNTIEEVDRFLELLPAAIGRLRPMASRTATGVPPMPGIWPDSSPATGLPGKRDAQCR